MILSSWMLGLQGRLPVADGVAHIVAESFWKPEFAEPPQRTGVSSHDFR